MKSILKKHILVLAISIIGCVIAIIGIGILFATTNSKTTRVSEIKERLASYQKNKKAFEDEAKELRVLQERLSILEKHVVTSDSLPVLLSSLEGLASKNGIGFEITSVQTPIENEKPKLLIEATAKGSYLGLRTFFAQLEHQPFQVKLKRLYLFSEQAETTSIETAGTLSGPKTTKPVISKEVGWQGVVTIEVLSF